MKSQQHGWAWPRMYKGLPARVPYSAPWSADYEERLRMLRPDTVRIGYVYEEPDTSTFRYRAFNMVEALNSSPGRVSATWFTRNDYEDDPAFLKRVDILVLCRVRYDDAVARLVALAKARDIAVVFDIDDLVCDPDLVHLIVHTLDVSTSAESWDYWFAYVSRLHASFMLCDCATTTNDYLAARLQKIRPGLRCAVIPNFLNRRQSQLSNKLWLLRQQARPPRDRSVTVGYLSGTPSHNRDLRVAAPALVRLLKQYPRVRLRIVGFNPGDRELESVKANVEYEPLQDFLNLQRTTAECEFTIAPLQDNVFTNCKSELKYFEPAIVGSPVIASPTFAFKSVIVDGVNGFLASAHEWYDTLEKVLHLVEDNGELFEALADSARSHAQTNYSAQQADRILSSYEEIVAGVSFS